MAIGRSLLIIIIFIMSLSYVKADTLDIQFKDGGFVNIKYETSNISANETIFKIYAPLKLVESRGENIYVGHSKGTIWVPRGILYCNSEIISKLQPTLVISPHNPLGLSWAGIVYRSPIDFQCDGVVKIELKKVKSFVVGSSFLYPFDSYLWQLLYTKEKLTQTITIVRYDSLLPETELGQIIYFNDSLIVTKIYNLTEELEDKSFFIKEGEGIDYFGLINLKTKIRGLLSLSAIFFYIYLILLILLVYSIKKRDMIFGKYITIFLLPLFLWVLNFSLTKYTFGFNLFNLLAGTELLLAGFYSLYVKEK